MRILSIDWDYFMDCSENDRLEMFPDGGNENVGLMMSTMIWGMRYGDTKYKKDCGITNKELSDIGIKENDLERVLDFILNNVNWDTKVIFADSHRDIYEFVKENCDNDESLEVINIDHHSDCYNLGEEVNCGNWANHLAREGYLDKFVWIHGNGEETLKDDVLGNVVDVSMSTLDYLDELDSEGLDLIFICRSSIWSPPHLDVRFNEFHSFFKDEIGMLFNEKFFVDRYSLLGDRIDEEYKLISKLKSGFKGFVIGDESVIDESVVVNESCEKELEFLKDYFKKENKENNE